MNTYMNLPIIEDLKHNQKVCAYCGKVFTAKSKNQKYHTPLCRKLANAKILYKPYEFKLDTVANSAYLVTHKLYLMADGFTTTKFAFTDAIGEIHRLPLCISYFDISRSYRSQYKCSFIGSTISIEQPDNDPDYLVLMKLTVANGHATISTTTTKVKNYWK